jgi:DNA invertase Pin-like site-specific DNA recombinase
VALAWGIYARISSDRGGDQLGVGRQIADCRRKARELGVAVWEPLYIDDDVSAWSGKRRPAYEQMLDDLRDGLIGGVVVWHVDRLTRHPRELETIIELRDALDFGLASVTGEVDLSTGTGRLTARMLGGLARYESDHKSERIRRKHEELALRGKVSGGGSRPFGYEADKVTVRPAEAEIVRECAERFLAGESLRSISLNLNERGVRTASGGEWAPQTLRRMLAYARLSGQREHNGEIVATAEWPAIITPAQTAEIRTRLADPDRRTNKAARRYLLGGLLVCSHCGERLVARPRAGGQRRYACARGPGLSGCGKTYINADQVELFVVEAVLHRVDAPEVAATVAGRPADPDMQPLYAGLDADQAQLAELAEAYGNKLMTMKEWLAARGPIEARITAARKKLARASQRSTLEPFVGKGEQLRADWASLDLSQQHSIVAAVLDHLVVGPGRRGYNRFDESRLTPFWRP